MDEADLRRKLSREDRALQLVMKLHTRATNKIMAETQSVLSQARTANSSQDLSVRNAITLSQRARWLASSSLREISTLLDRHETEVEDMTSQLIATPGWHGNTTEELVMSLFRSLIVQGLEQLPAQPVVQELFSQFEKTIRNITRQVISGNHVSQNEKFLWKVAEEYYMQAIHLYHRGQGVRFETNRRRSQYWLKS